MKESRVGVLLLFILSLMLYAQTVSFDYALDDKIVITNNQITQRGFEGLFMHFKHDAMDGFWANEYGVPVEELKKGSLVAGGRYRPLTLATHTWEWAVFKEAPGISHMVNAILYATLVLFIFLWVKRLLKEPEPERFYLSTAFWAALLFAVHPLHTEVVANIKGRDEILSFLFGVSALYYGIKAYDSGKPNQMLLPVLLITLGYFAKETTVTFVAVWPATLWFFRRSSFVETLKWSWQPLLAAIFYLWIRSLVIESGGEPTQLMNNPFLNATVSQKWAAVVLTFSAYYKLVFFPWPLTHDYYPYHLPFTEASAQFPEWSHPAVILGLLITVLLLILAIGGTLKRDKRVFGITLFFITFLPVSNLIFPVGVFMNERFMFVPSMGIILSVLLLVRARLNAPLAAGKIRPVLMLIIAAVFAVLTVIRNRDWKNDEALALADVKTSVGSAKAQMGAGDALLKRIKDETSQTEKNKLISEAFAHLKTSLEIHPNYFPPRDLLGQLYFYSGQYEESVKWYKACAQMKPGRPQFVQNMTAGARKLKENEEYPAAERAFNKVLEQDPNNINALENLAEIHARHLGNTGKAFEYLQRGLQLDPDNGLLTEKMGIVYAMNQDFENAFTYFNRAMELRPDDPGVMRNMAVTYMQLGDEQKGRELMGRANALENNK